MSEIDNEGLFDAMGHVPPKPPHPNLGSPEPAKAELSPPLDPERPYEHSRNHRLPEPPEKRLSCFMVGLAAATVFTPIGIFIWRMITNG